MIKLYNNDCTKVLDDIISSYENLVFVSDPPFNIGYHYNTYKDRMKEDEYFNWLSNIFSKLPTVIILYPESLYKLAITMNKAPNKVVSWVYNSNTRKQHRDIAFFDVIPDFKKVTQPYKNPNDKRIKKLIEKGKTGASLYDWWNVNQVKNVSKVKTSHPCQMPLEIMKNIVGILPDDITIIDPFMGSGTTGVACKQLNKNFIGIEIDETYFEIAQRRIIEGISGEEFGGLK